MLVVKAHLLNEAKRIFTGTGVIIKADGNRHLGAALGTQTFVEAYVKEKVEKWSKHLDTLTSFAITEPQAAYSCYLIAVKAKWSFLQRTIPNTAHLFQPLEDRLRNAFLPTIAGWTLTDIERDVAALPARDGGLGVSNPVSTAQASFEMSVAITTNLSALITNQSDDLAQFDREEVQKKKREWIKNKREGEKIQKRSLIERINAEQVCEEVPQETDEPSRKGRKPPDPPLIRALEMASQRGASSWLTARPLGEYDFSLSKRDFRDGLHVRYGKRPADLPQRCACGEKFDLQHALDCKTGGFVHMRHDHIRNLFAELFTKAGCHGVEMEQQLLPVQGELDHALKSAVRAMRPGWT